MKTVAIIPARGGSKGIPGKNIKMISGKPLIAWSIESAINSSCIDKVLVSTDCQEISKISLNFGAEVPFLRPSNLSGDNSTTEDAIMHAIDFMESKDELYDFICLLQPTSPVRGKNSIDNAFQRFLTTESDSLLSVVEYNHFLWKDFDSPISLYNYNKRPMRQHKADEDRVYRENGSIYFFKVNSFKKYRNRLHKKISLFEMNEDERHEVDSNDDFIVIESILDKKNEL